MNINQILDIAKHEFQQKLIAFCQNHDFTKLTPENAEEFAKGLRDGLSAAGAVAYKSFIENYDENDNTIIKDGEVFRFKHVSQKDFLTPFGEITLDRQLVPAPHRWLQLCAFGREMGYAGAVRQHGSSRIDFVFGGLDDSGGDCLLAPKVRLVSSLGHSH